MSPFAFQIQCLTLVSNPIQTQTINFKKGKISQDQSTAIWNQKEKNKSCGSQVIDWFLVDGFLCWTMGDRHQNKRINLSYSKLFLLSVKVIHLTAMFRHTCQHLFLWNATPSQLFNGCWAFFSNRLMLLVAGVECCENIVVFAEEKREMCGIVPKYSSLAVLDLTVVR